LSHPVHVCPGGGVTVVSQRCNVELQIDTARVPSSHRVCDRGALCVTRAS
jgi:hypothetical protein